MKMTNWKLGFTLIELLVVITIIGILSTWAVNVYTSQIQKARDSTRLTDMKALVSWIEQLYQEDWNYPSVWASTTASIPSFIDIRRYTPTIPKDPRTNQKSWASNFEYAYTAGSDGNNIRFQTYEVSIQFESEWNTNSKSAVDWWNDVSRLEQGINIDALLTTLNWSALAATSWIWSTWAPTYICWSAVAQNAAGDATTAAWTCMSGAPTTTAVNTQVLIIK